jgi:hypothetical protein
VAGTYSVTHVRNSEIKQLWPLFFAMLWDVDLIFICGCIMISYRSIYVSFRSNNFWPSYGPWTLKFGQIFSCDHFFLHMLGDIDLIFGIWVYNDESQIKITFRSGPMIFDRVMSLGLWNLAKYLVVTTFFRYAWKYWLDFWYMSI